MESSLVNKQKIMELANSQRFEEALAVGKQVCQQYPGDAEAWFLLGAINGQLGDFSEAETCCRQALRLQPEHAMLHYNLAIALLNQDKLDEAIAQFEEAIRIQPQYAEACHDLGNALQARGKLDQAIDSYRQAIRLQPALAPAHYNLANAYRDQDRLDEAAASYQHALELKPDFIQACSELAAIHIHRFQYDKAVGLLEPAIEQAPDIAELHFKLGVALQEQGEADTAIQAYQRALDLEPEHVDSQVGMAGALSQMGDYKSAHTLLSPLIEQNRESHATAITFGHLAHRFGREDEATDILLRHLQQSDVSNNSRAKLNFALASLLDRRKDYDRAFKHYKTGNDLRDAEFDIDYYKQGVASLRKIYRYDGIRKLPRSGIENNLPIFIVGMPRSGTSLVEQILASHPDIFGAGELGHMNRIVSRLPSMTPGKLPYPHCMEDIGVDALDSLAMEYIEKLRSHSMDAKHITDKMPDNFWHLGLIDRMLPGARIIHCTRDPVDTCLSCYFVYFSGSHPYAYNLTNLGLYYRQYHALMEHWKKVIQVPLLEVNYQDLVTNQEEVTRTLLDFCGLPWNEDCMHFYKKQRTVATASSSQVRQPIYTRSLKRWKNYEKHLGPLISALGDLQNKDPSQGLQISR